MRCYPYECDCGYKSDVFKNLSDIDRIEVCPDCGDNMERKIARTHFYGADDWDKAEYNPAFGKVIKNKKHRDAEAKRLGLVEMGNENIANYHKKKAAEREEKALKRWDKV